MKEPEVFIHRTAEVSAEAQIGAGTKIWHFSHIREGARIGRNSVVGQNVYVAPTAILGEGVKIQNNVSIYDGVILEDHVFCGPSAVFTNVKNPRSEVSRRDSYEITRIARGATIGANATVVCGVTVGTYAFIGAGATVTADVLPFALMLGSPARQEGWSCRCGLTLLRFAKDPRRRDRKETLGQEKNGQGETLQCADCQSVYLWEGKELRELTTACVDATAPVEETKETGEVAS